MIKYLALFILLLPMLAYADLACMGDTTPNLKTDFRINCITKPSLSRCIANVTDNSTTPINIGQYPEYPNNIFQEDRTPYITFDNGQFMAAIFLDDNRYSTFREYTATITCFDTSDNTTNSTEFTFIPSNYPPPNQIGQWGEWAISYNILFVFIILLIFIALALFYLRILGKI